MKVTCIADLHGEYPKLDWGHLLIVAGDLTASDQDIQYRHFYEWLDQQDYACKVVISGNHDSRLHPIYIDSMEFGHYLCDSSVEFRGLKIWGSPWTKTFPGMNPLCKAYTCDTDEQLAEKWALIPEDTDILVTHGPPYGTMDFVTSHWNEAHYRKEVIPKINAGSKSLRDRGNKLGKLKLWVWGHLHENRGIVTENGCTMVCCSHMNREYEPVNRPVYIEL